MINCPACSPFLKKGINGHLTALCLAEASIHPLPPFDSGAYAHLQVVTAEGPCFCIVPCRSAPFSFWSRCRTLPSPRGGLVAFAICLCLRVGLRKKNSLGWIWEPTKKITPKKKAKDRTPALPKKKKGGVVESTLAFVPAFVCMLNYSLLTREPFPRFWPASIVYGSMQGIATLLAWLTLSSLSNFAFELKLIGVVHVLRLPASGPMYIVFRLLPLMVVWVLFCLVLLLRFLGFCCFRQLALVQLLCTWEVNWDFLSET